MKQIFVILGPSGSGKSTLGDALRAEGVPEIISTTTRNIRPGEQHGVNYYYVTPEEFAQLEMVEETVYAGNNYGLSKQEVDYKLEKSDTIYAILDQVGIRRLQNLYGKSIVKVVYMYCSEDTLVRRMQIRGESPEIIQKRLNHLHNTNELNLIDMADWVIRTDRHSLEDNIKMIKFIVLGQ